MALSQATTGTRGQEWWKHWVNGALVIYDHCTEVVCLFQGWDGYWFPHLPDERVHICRDPHSCEFPLHHYGGLGTRTNCTEVFFFVKILWKRKRHWAESAISLYNK